MLLLPEIETWRELPVRMVLHLHSVPLGLKTNIYMLA